MYIGPIYVHIGSEDLLSLTVVATSLKRITTIRINVSLSLRRLLCGPVQRSVFIEDCSDCQIVIACQQVNL